MDAATWLGLEETDTPLRWRLPVSAGVCSGYRQLFGGAGLAAALVALEKVTGRRTVWATAQYLRYAAEGTSLDLEVIIPVTGHRISQGRVVARSGGEEILTVVGAFGDRPTDEVHTLAPFPRVPPPDECPVRRGPGTGNNLGGRLEVRLARGRHLSELDGSPGDGRVCVWARVTGAMEASAAWLAVIGDLVPSGVADVRGVMGGGNSLDNTLRVLRLAPSPWILCDIGIDGLARGFAHGWGHLWSQDGTLMATASQSVIVRSHDARRPPRPRPEALGQDPAGDLRRPW
jgi:acyl-CoA thioesterase-2